MCLYNLLSCTCMLTYTQFWFVVLEFVCQEQFELWSIPLKHYWAVTSTSQHRELYCESCSRLDQDQLHFVLGLALISLMLVVHPGLDNLVVAVCHCGVQWSGH